MDEAADEEQIFNVQDLDLARAPVPATNDGEVGEAFISSLLNIDLTTYRRFTQCASLISSQWKPKNSTLPPMSHPLIRKPLHPCAGARTQRTILFCSQMP